jgi:hypothetical protein
MKNEKIDCPLCQAKGAITYTKPTMVTHVRPTYARKNQTVIGNYTRGYEGGGHDLSHAQKCPKLKYVVDKKGLLNYHLFGEGSHSDFLFYEDYQRILKDAGFGLTLEVFRQKRNSGGEGPLVDKNEWRFRMFIHSVIASTQRRYLVTEANSPEKAFDLIRHRLLCGEVITHTNPGMQLVRKDMSLALVSVPKRRK